MDAGVDIAGLRLAPVHPRAVFFAAFQRFVAARLPDAQRSFDSSELGVSLVRSVVPATMEDLRLHGEMLAVAERRLTSSAGRRAWLLAAQAVREHQPRAAMTSKPTWSFAGDLLSTARGIEARVSRTVPVGRGSKDDLPLVYVSNPPRHGKSLLLDNLFPDEAAAGVCVLGVTYNAATPIGREDRGATAVGALRGLLLRLLNCLVFGKANWDDIWESSPIEAAANPLQVFREMLDLENAAAPPLLVCIDEVSKLIDDDACVWARDATEQKAFWRGLFSLTHARHPGWARVVMTGFTDSPHDAVSASDVACVPVGLSMITDPEAQLLAAELVWAYAVENKEPFPGLLWTLVKSTPGLLGLWAQQIDLHRHVNSACRRCAVFAGAADLCPTGVKADVAAAMRTGDLNRMAAMVPWVSVLMSNAERNWPRIVRFLKEEDALTRDTVRACRDADLATVLGMKQALSPFAVAITVLALRCRDLPVDDSGVSIGAGMYGFINDALIACESHSAGCAEHMPQSWRVLIQHRLQKRPEVVDVSEVLRADPRLAVGAAKLAEPSAILPGATVSNIGTPYENFVLHAVALRLECLRQAAQTGVFPASRLLPRTIGTLRRAPLVAGSGMIAAFRRPVHRCCPANW